MMNSQCKIVEYPALEVDHVILFLVITIINNDDMISEGNDSNVEYFDNSVEEVKESFCCNCTGKKQLCGVKCPCKKRGETPCGELCDCQKNTIASNPCLNVIVKKNDVIPKGRVERKYDSALLEEYESLDGTIKQRPSRISRSRSQQGTYDERH
jgi:hypothetical protein